MVCVEMKVIEKLVDLVDLVEKKDNKEYVEVL